MRRRAVLTRFGHRVVAAVGEIDALHSAVAAERPDVVVTDVRMPPSFTDEGLRAALDLRREHPGLPVLVGEAPEPGAEPRRNRRESMVTEPSGNPDGGGPVTSPQPAIAVAGLRKSFGKQVVLDGINFEVAAGTTFALLGPNGAGKTTTVHILSTLLPPDGGSALVAGADPTKNPDAVRRAIGVTGQFSAVDGLLTGTENLELMANLHHLGRAEGRRRSRELLERFDLVDAAKKPVSAYSGGMRRRLDLAMTLIGSPSVIFLDEPTTGLDPRSRQTMWEVIRRLVADGVTIFLTTQYLEEADQLADRIAVLDHGKLVAVGTPAELKRQIPGGHVRLVFADENTVDAATTVLPDAVRDGLSLTVPGSGNVQALRALLDRLAAASVEVEELSVHTPDLDDVFFSLTGSQEAVR